MEDRRTKEGYRLRVYIDAIKEAKAMTEAEWVDGWIRGPKDAPYTPLSTWIIYLEQCVIAEASNLMRGEAA